MPNANISIALTGLITPGLGHWLLGRRRRAVAFFVLISLLFFIGVFLERDFYTKFGTGILTAKAEPVLSLADTRDELESVVDRVWRVVFIYAFPFFVGFANYAAGLKWTALTAGCVTWLPSVASIDEIPVTMRDIGYCFALLAGLLNLLVMMDAYDIACNDEELARRTKT